MFQKKRLYKPADLPHADVCINDERSRLQREAETVEVTEGMDELSIEERIQLVRWIAKQGLFPRRPPEILEKCIEHDVDPEQAPAFRYFLERGNNGSEDV